MSNESTQEVLANIKEEANAQENAESTAQRTVGKSVKQNWDCSQVEEEEDEEVKDSQDEEQKLEEILERKRMERNSLQLEVVQKVPELVVQERLTQGKEVRDTKGKKNEKGWFIEEMKGKVNSRVEMDTEEMLK